MPRRPTEHSPRGEAIPSVSPGKTVYRVPLASGSYVLCTLPTDTNPSELAAAMREVVRLVRRRPTSRPLRLLR